MNEFGENYIKKQRKNLEKLDKNTKQYFIKLNWEDSIIQERIMRLGIEKMKYQLNSERPTEYIDMARATLIEDEIKRLEDE